MSRQAYHNNKLHRLLHEMFSVLSAAAVKRRRRCRRRLRTHFLLPSNERTDGRSKERTGSESHGCD